MASEFSAASETELVFRRGKECPEGLYRGTIVSYQDSVYCSSLGSNTVYRYILDSREWQTLSACPVAAFALVVVDGSLIAVGGEVCTHYGKRTPTNTLYSYTAVSCKNGTTWSVCYPPMPTKRSYCAAVCHQNSLVVVGGQTTYVQSAYCLTTVEVMDTHLKQWFRVSPLPWPVRSPSLAIHDSLFYLAGGWDDSGTRILKSDVVLLRSTCKPLISQTASKLGDSVVTVWEEMTPAPVCNCSCGVLGGHLFLFGGRGRRGRVSERVYVCEEGERGEVSWKDVRLRQPVGASYHSLCVSMCGGEGVMVIGGLQGGGIPIRDVWTAQLISQSKNT